MMIRWLARGSILASVLLVAVASTLAVAGWIEDVRPCDVIVVPGNTVFPDGTLSPRLAGRVERARELFEAGMAPFIFVSGGVGKEGRDEAAAMAAFLTQRGVPADRILLDSQGLTTAATAKNIAHLMKQRQWNSALVVSQFYHLPRCRLALRQEGVRDIATARSHYLELRDVWSLFREVFAYRKYLLS